MDAIKQALQALGLTEKETELYLASLAVGESGMTEVAKKAKLKRSTAYLIFKALEQKGLMGSFKMRTGLRFVATKPELLVEKAQKSTSTLANILPQLQGIMAKPDHKPKITYYEGKEGYFLAAEESLRLPPRSIIRHIGSLRELHTIVGLDYDVNSYIPNRVKKHIFFRGLYFQSDIPETITKRNHLKELREIRLLPETYKHHTSMLIYGNKVAIFSMKKDLITVIIESEEIVQSERNKFDLLWKLVGS